MVFGAWGEGGVDEGGRERGHKARVFPIDKKREGHRSIIDEKNKQGGLCCDDRGALAGGGRPTKPDPRFPPQRALARRTTDDGRRTTNDEKRKTQNERRKEPLRRRILLKTAAAALLSFSGRAKKEVGCVLVQA